MPLVDDVLRAALLGKKITLNKIGSMDEKLKISNQAVSILNNTIQFVPAKKPYEAESTALKAKYIRLRGQEKNSFNFNVKIESCSSQPSPSKRKNLGSISFTPSSSTASDVPPPIFEIFPLDEIRLTWDPKFRRSTAVGLHNLGNTCFLNSVLQVLTNTGPLVNHLLSGEHDVDKCPKSTGFCALCLIKGHIQRVFNLSNGGSISPGSIVDRVRCFMKSHSSGRQEDAHEFLRYFIDAMQTAALYSFRGKKLDLYTKETSVIGRIFGGYHKNEVTCNNCHFESTTYDPFLDLCVEVKRCDSLEAALAHFTRVETLSNENAYKCPRCKTRASAKKMFTIHQAPNVLTVQLKRFDHMGKIDRYVSYPERLNLRPYMTEKQGPPVNYRLYGVVVHHGRSTRSGHYYAFVRNPCDQWHLLDDSRAAAVSPNQALKSPGAYLLFYVRTPVSVLAIKPLPKSIVVEPVDVKPMPTPELKQTVMEAHLKAVSSVGESSAAPDSVNRLERQNESKCDQIGSPSKKRLLASVKEETDEGKSTDRLLELVKEESDEEQVRLQQKRKECSDADQTAKPSKKQRLLGASWEATEEETEEANSPAKEEAKEKKKFNVVVQLKKLNKFGGYGFSVKSWSGKPNAVDRFSTDNDSGLGDEERDHWNGELDQGKIKKKKKKYGQFFSMGRNPFQKAQNTKNRKEQARRMIY